MDENELEDIRLEEVHWMLRANKLKNPAGILDEIIEARGLSGEDKGGNYVGCLFQVKGILRGMGERGWVEAIPRSSDKYALTKDSAGQVYDFFLTGEGMADRPAHIRWERQVE